MKKLGTFIRFCVAFGLAGFLFSGCAHTPAHTCSATSWPDRTLESFGKFDTKTTYGDLLARVGKPEFGMNLSGLLSLDYHLTNDTWVMVEIAGSSPEAKIFQVELGVSGHRRNKVLYSQIDALQQLPEYNLDVDLNADRTYSLESRDFTLSLKRPVDPETKIKLLSVERTLTTTIRLDSGEQLVARPGGYFACEQTGRHGLQLISASYETGEAVFEQMQCVSR